MKFTLTSKVRTHDGKKAGIYWIGPNPPTGENIIHGWIEDWPCRLVRAWHENGQVFAPFNAFYPDENLVLVPEKWLLFDKDSKEIIQNGDEYVACDHESDDHKQYWTPCSSSVGKTVGQSRVLIVRRRVES